MKKTYITKEKYKALEAELHTLLTETRKEIAEKLEYARSLGDLSENAEYHDARDQQAKAEDDIVRIEEILKNASIIKEHTSDVVELGTTVTVQKKGDKNKTEYTLVGPEEADLASGRISYSSPLGTAMTGTKKGDTFTFTTPKGSVEYKVVSIK